MDKPVMLLVGYVIYSTHAGAKAAEAVATLWPR